MPSFNILGAVMANGVSFAILLTLNHITMNKVLKVKIRFIKSCN